MSNQETIDRLTRELSDKHETLMLFLEGLNGQQALTAHLMGILEGVMIAFGVGEGDAETRVQEIVRHWQEEHGYGKTVVEWTTVRPTKPGRYWCLYDRNTIRSEMVSISNHGDCYVRGMLIDGRLEDALWWPIPIEPPPVPTAIEKRDE